MYFKLVLTNGVDDLVLYFKVMDSNIAKKWFAELSNNYELDEVDRFTNWGKHSYIDQLNKQIDTINLYDNIIDMYVSENSTQQDLNYLHKFFEDLRGEINAGTNWYTSAPTDIKNAVNRFNVLIHHLEAELRTKDKHPTVVVTFKDNPKIDLDKEDMKYFTYKWKSGTVYINYCHVGKTVIDAFKDRDSITEAIRPQTRYSADFMIKFGPSIGTIQYLVRSVFLKIWIRIKKLKFDDLNLGMIPVATLVTEIDYKTLLKYNKVKKIECLK